MGGGMYAGRAFAATALVLLLSACATPEGAFPSLARRDAERVTGTITAAEEPASLPAPEPLSPDLERRLEQLEAQAKAGHARFRAREPRARQATAAARGAAVGSESWAVATIAIAELEAARSQVMIALADLDSLYVAERAGGREGFVVAFVRVRTDELVRQEDAVLAELARSLRD
jgi:hypothetical protein